MLKTDVVNVAYHALLMLFGGVFNNFPWKTEHIYYMQYDIEESYSIHITGFLKTS